MAARSTGETSRNRARRAARRFVKRHRRNFAYLRWVTAALAKDAAVALALLGLGAGVARAAGAPVFDPFPTAFLTGVTVGGRAAPTLADLDADGDLDLLSGEYGGAFRFFANTGTAISPSYVERTGILNPANGLSAASVHSHPALVDLDGDGDLDLVAGSLAGTFQTFLNTGDARNAHFTAGANPLAAIDVGDSSAATFGDLDGDGDLDLLAGDRIGLFHYFENTGTKTAASFVERTGSANPMGAFALGLGLGSLASPALGDADGDGDLDVVAGWGQGGFLFYRNRGTSRRPSFEELVGASNPLRGETVGSSFSKAALGDVDADGDLDLVGGKDGGGFVVFENEIGQLVASADFEFDLLSTAFNEPMPGGDLDGDGDFELTGADCSIAYNTGSPTNPLFPPPSVIVPGTPAGCARSTIVDLDRDGRYDLYQLGQISLNNGTPTSPTFAPPVQIFPASLGLLPFPNFPLWATFGDVDHDGDADAMVSYALQNPVGLRTYYFENVGTGPAFSFVARMLAEDLLSLPFFNNHFLQARLMDVDQDGDADVLANYDGLGRFATYLENVGSTTPSFVLRLSTDRKNPFSRIAQLYASSFATWLPTALAEFDGDGDPDSVALIVNDDSSLFDMAFVENGIVRPSPKYFGPVGTPFTTEDAGSLSSPAAGDLDGDGDPDFVAAESFDSGTLHYYENVGTAVLPRVIERFGAANPFNGLNAGFTPLITLVDLDADGDLDLVAGSYSSEPLHYFLNTGTSRVPAFVERVAGLNPFQFVFVDRGAPAFGDVDGDGDPDLVVGGVPGTLRYFRNGGLAVSGLFSEVTGASNPFDGIVVGPGFMAHPALGDVDLDGDLDLVAGDEPTGNFFYYENAGTAIAPAYSEKTGVQNPLDGLSVGAGGAATPALVDLDADGDLDVVSGSGPGTFETFTLPEPSTPSLLAAGLGLLRGLWRRRRNRA